MYQTCNLVVSSQARHWWVAGAIYVWKCQKQSACWLQPEWRVQCESGRLPRLLLTVAHDPRSHFTWVSYMMSLWKPVRRWPGHHYWTAGGIKQKLTLWKTNMEWKGLPVNMGKTKVLISGPGLDVLQKSRKDPWDVCLKGVGTNSIFCCGCSSWIHKKGSGIHRRLRSDASFRCKWCTGQARPIDGRLMTEVRVGREKLEVVPSFSYIGDCLSAGLGCELATITSWRVAWGNFNELLHVLTSRSFPITCSGIVYN